MGRIFVLATCAGAVLRTDGLKTSHSNSLTLNICAGLSVSSFEDFVRIYGKEYAGEEYSRRQELFETHLEQMAAHNCADEHPWKNNVNQMADWTEAELQSLRGYKRVGSASSKGSAAPVTRLSAGAEEELPEMVSYGHLESIKRQRDQKQCGSCWAYAAVTVLDSHAELTNRSHRFSVAQVLACTPNPQLCGGAGGCDGATAELAYEYAMQAQIADDSDFPTTTDGKKRGCPEDGKPWGDFVSTGESTKVVHMKDGTQKHMIDGNLRMKGGLNGLLGWTRFPENNELELVRGLVNHGPVAVAVAAGADWNWYSYGILTPQGCDSENVISHAVVLYGYGQATNVRIGQVRYWQIKNSWGHGWGEDGSMRLQRLGNEEGTCGWDNRPQVGSGCKGGPDKVLVCGSCGILYHTSMPVMKM
jgi:cathepsin L